MRGRGRPSLGEVYVSLLSWQAHQVVGLPMASSCEEDRARAGMIYSHGAEEGCSPHLLDLGGRGWGTNTFLRSLPIV